MKFGVVVFPGTNCDTDTYNAINYLGYQVEYLWHQQQDISGFDCLILPGGFSYGDYLRCGAIARFSPVMQSVKKFADQGGLVMGICNGFQILLEVGLLPGSMLPNKNLKFICQDVYLRVESKQIPFTNLCRELEVLKMPINHYEGNYYIDPHGLISLESHNQIVLRYCTSDGRVTEEAAPNGALGNIAGICNRQGNVFGLMPHPERVVEDLLGGTDGQKIFNSVAKSFSK
jgi:phosphoribosylformylglycinamidine synthase